MFSIILQGGLGNQLFQIFAALSYSITYGKRLLLPYYLQSWDKRNTYWNGVFNSEAIQRLLYDNITNIWTLREYKESGFEYSEIPEMEEDFVINGYFQSHKYFEENYEKICEILMIYEKRESVRQRHYDNGYTNTNTISLHFRMGDYKNGQAHHPLMSDNYYMDAIKYIINNTRDTCDNTLNILYTCEKEDDEIVSRRISNMSLHFSNVQFIKVNNDLEDWEQMLLMSLCNHNIIANSTFSWWSAYINDNPNKIVCYPSIWFGYAKSDWVIKDLHPESWIKINNDK
jgi:hypothetical protein